MSKPVTIASALKRRNSIIDIVSNANLAENFIDEKENERLQVHTDSNGDKFLDLHGFCGSDVKLLAELDADGDGKISVKEVLEGVRAKQESDKIRKILAWLLGGAVILCVIIVAVIAGILHLQFQANKDTELASSGTMMVKNTKTASALEVSMKAHGEVFNPNNSIVDATGTEKKCVDAETARKMFVSATKGTNAKFVETNSITGELDVVNMAGSTCNSDRSADYVASWNNEQITLGSMALVPSMECTVAAGNGRRHLSKSDLMNNHRSLRDYTFHTFILGKDGGDVNDETSMNYMGRRLNTDGEIAFEAVVEHDYEDKFFDELPQNVRIAVTALGYVQHTWDSNQTPPNLDKYWTELSEGEQQAARTLGYTEEAWCDGDCNPLLSGLCCY